MALRLALLVILAGCAHHIGEASWSIQGKDDAIEGCPTRYHEWIDLPDGERVLIGCWGDEHAR